MLKIALCDDLRRERDVLRKKLAKLLAEKQIPYLLEEYESGAELAEKCIENQYHLVFLDILMNQENGITVAKEIRKQNEKVKIIFVTTSRDYVLDSYDVYAYYYLLKPLQEERIRSCMDRFLREFQAQQEGQSLFIKTGSNSIYVPYHEIEYVESDNTVLSYHLINGKVVKSYGKLNAVEEQLPDTRFLRCHQSYLINMDHVKMVQEEFFMRSGDRVLIRKKEQKKLKEQYFIYIIEKEENRHEF